MFCRYSANEWPSEMYIISLLSLCLFVADIASFREMFFFNSSSNTKLEENQLCPLY